MTQPPPDSRPGEVPEPGLAPAEPEPAPATEERPAPEPSPEPEPPPAAAALPAESPRVLRRSRDDRVIAGICGGLGRYFGVDPVILRIAFVVLLLAGGAGLLLYIVGWIAIPEERPGEVVGEAGATTHDRGAGAEVIGIGLVLLGLFFLAREVFPDVFDSDYLWPLALIVIGLAVLARAVRR